MAGVITFRPTPEAQELLDRVRDEGTNVSKYINSMLTQGRAEGGEYTQIVSCYPEHQYRGTSVVQKTVPISRLSAHKYREFLDTLYSQQLKYYYFKVSEQHTFGIIATCHEEASIEFARYYVLDKADGSYNRTSVPLPQVRYDTANRVAVVITTELLTIKNRIMYKETTGKIVKLLDEKFGKTKSGKDYQINDYLLELNSGTEHVHCIKFAMQSFDGPIQNPIQVGQEVKVGLKIVAQQYNGKWYNEVTLHSWEPLV